MRKKILITAICFSFLFIFTGCASIAASVRSTMSGYPSWYYNPQEGRSNNQVGFSAVGRSSTKRQATLLAYENIISEIGEYLGDNPDSDAYRELCILGTIGVYGLSVKETQVLAEGSETVVFVRAVADKKLLDEASSDESKRRLDVQSAVESYIEQGVGYLKKEQVTKALEVFLQAMCTAWNQDYLAQKYSFDSIFKEVTDIISSMSITLENLNPGAATCTVVVTRKEALIPSKVENGEILASYKVLDTGENEYDDSFVYSTDSYGSFEFTPLNYSLKRSGKIVFSLNLDEYVEKLGLCGVDEGTLEKLRSLIDSRTVEFVYNRDYSLGSIAVCGVEYDAKGYVTDFVSITDYIVSRFADDGAPAVEFITKYEDIDDITADYSLCADKQDCFLVFRVGAVEQSQSKTGQYMASVSGNAVLYRISDMAVLYDSGIIGAAGFADSSDGALSKASENLADVIYTLLKAVYV